MDDLLISVNSIQVSDEDELNVSSPIASNIHPRLSIYKKRSNFKSSQAERRKQILAEQKKKREAQVESTRSIKKSSPQAFKVQKKTDINLQYVNRLMFSEWLEEIPFDLGTNWIMVLCPVGKRCLVVASEGNTSVYNKAGKLIARHTSKLPGGSKDSKIDQTILDCIYNDFLRTYFILDCLSWKSHPIVDSETEFRFYWLKCKLEEAPEVGSQSYENPYVFKDVPRVWYLSNETIQKEFFNGFYFNIDGVLFYHKEAHYAPGYTPLVGWLKPYMIPEILGVQMPDWVLNLAPSDYISAKNSIDRFENEQKNKFKSLNESMEVLSNDQILPKQEL